MTRRLFKLAEHPEYGGVGLAPAWMPDHQADPIGGMGCAHDVLEHGPRDRVEWQGLGGAVYVRGDDYFIRRGRYNPSCAENVGSDFVNLFHLWQGEDIPEPPRCKPLADSYEDGIIDRAVMHGCNLVRQEFDGDGDRAKLAERWTRTEQRARMRGWMRLGYRAAARRWRHVRRCELVETFCKIEEAIDRFLQDDAESYVGADVVLRFDVRQCAASCELVYDDPYL